MPKLSVIVPVYNVEPYLDRCVKSLLAQTLRDIEIILVDDGSPDRCPALCDDYARRYPNVSVVHKANAGLGMACNSGLDVATGDYVAFVDSDDWVDPEMYATMVEAAETHDAQLVFTGLRRVDSTGKTLTLMAHPDALRLYTGSEVATLLADMISASPEARYDLSIQVSAKVVLYSRQLLSANSLRFVSERQCPSEDLIFNVAALAKATRAVVLPRYFYNYFFNDCSITSTVRKGQFDRVLNSVSRLEEITRVAGLDVQTRIDRFTIAYARSIAGSVARSSLPLSQRLAELRQIASSSLWPEIARRYPSSLMPLLHRLYFRATVGGHPWLMLLFAKLH